MSFLLRHRLPKSDAARSSQAGSAFYDPLWLIPRTLTKLFSVWVRAVYPLAGMGRNVSLHYTCDLKHPELIRLGNCITIHKDVWIHAQDSKTGRTNPAIIIEDNCFIGRRSHISAQNCIHIEAGVMLSASVFIGDNGHTHTDLALPVRYQGVTEGGRIRIGEGGWIGQNAAILCDKGELILGRNCVVAANAVVTRSAPPYSVLSGNPARIVKQYDPAKCTWVLGSSLPAETGGARPQSAGTKEVFA